MRGASGGCSPCWRRAQIALTARGWALYEEAFPQVAAINVQLVGVLDDALVQALDAVLTRLTEAAHRHNGELARDVSADRRVGGSRRARP